MKRTFTALLLLVLAGCRTNPSQTVPDQTGKVDGPKVQSSCSYKATDFATDFELYQEDIVEALGGDDLDYNWLVVFTTLQSGANIRLKPCSANKFDYADGYGMPKSTHSTGVVRRKVPKKLASAASGLRVTSGSLDLSELGDELTDRFQSSGWPSWYCWAGWTNGRHSTEQVYILFSNTNEVFVIEPYDSENLVWEMFEI